jgi:lysozyme family protein
LFDIQHSVLVAAASRIRRFVMAKAAFTEALKREYEDLFNTCLIRPERADGIEDIIARLLGNRPRYESVGDAMAIPWFFIGVIHNMESGQSFYKHLHNGDPLTKRTVHVPAGRPKSGNPPFTWEASATDALTLRGVGAQTDWSLAGTLYQIEGYNGWGYRLYHPHVLSPYLWCFSTHYTSGKYVADGTWSDTAASKQCGAAVLLRRMAEANQIEFPDQPKPPEEAEPMIVTYSSKKSRDQAFLSRAEDLQRWLNTFPGIFVKVDGVPGEKTSDAYRRITGSYLPGDPRGS